MPAWQLRFWFLVFALPSNVVYQTEQICRSTEPSDKSVGTDCHFEYVCIAGHIDDQDALDSSDPRISDHGTWTVSAGWSEWRYGKDAKALSEY